MYLAVGFTLILYRGVQRKRVRIREGRFGGVDFVNIGCYSVLCIFLPLWIYII